MHIPDGYLSPSTCATLYICASGGWYAALSRIKRVFFSRAIPLISVFAAFSFVLMMFNLPLPGGTTGHAVGVAVATIVLGPSGSILAISIALAIQALFFGDGGITTLGANCFNIAIVGSLVAHLSYKLLAVSAEDNSKRRIVAAAIAGYLSINAAALLTAIEFGIQPHLFHDAIGTPLYAPYPLRIAVPAMMLGHLTLAGLAEAVITSGMVAYLQKSNPGLLLNRGITRTNSASSTRTRSLAPLWISTALLMVLTPIGILATGTAWGEWSPEELAHHAALPQGTPSGLQRLSSYWTAPFPDYAPAFVKSESFGYVLSAMFGVGLLFAVYLLFSARTRRGNQSLGSDE
ncbi:MAG TPA: cobalt transporter CbiM [Clostridia bacterium]|nr:cobalt transporter CbiM [Clostridia bacterium]